MWAQHWVDINPLGLDTLIRSCEDLTMHPFCFGLNYLALIILSLEELDKARQMLESELILKWVELGKLNNILSLRLSSMMFNKSLTIDWISLSVFYLLFIYITILCWCFHWNKSLCPNHILHHYEYFPEEDHLGSFPLLTLGSWNLRLGSCSSGTYQSLFNNSSEGNLKKILGSFR